jgi:hypothetical protein
MVPIAFKATQETEVMDSFSQALDWFFAAGQGASCVCLAYGGYLSLRYLSWPFLEARVALGAPDSISQIPKREGA